MTVSLVNLSLCCFFLPFGSDKRSCNLNLENALTDEVYIYGDRYANRKARRIPVCRRRERLLTSESVLLLISLLVGKECLKPYKSAFPYIPYIQILTDQINFQPPQHRNRPKRAKAAPVAARRRNLVLYRERD